MASFVLMALGALALLVLTIDKDYSLHRSPWFNLLYAISICYVGLLTVLGGAFVGYWLGAGQ